METDLTFWQHLADIISGVMFLLVSFSFLYGYLFPNSFQTPNLSRIDTGIYLSEPTTKTDTSKISSLEHELAQLRKQIQESNKPNNQTNPLFTDCVDTLIALGTPARKAKVEAQNIFNNKNITSVEQFIGEIGK